MSRIQVGRMFRLCTIQDLARLQSCQMWLQTDPVGNSINFTLSTAIAFPISTKITVLADARCGALQRIVPALVLESENWGRLQINIFDQYRGEQGLNWSGQILREMIQLTNMKLDFFLFWDVLEMRNFHLGWMLGHCAIWDAGGVSERKMRRFQMCHN